MTPFDCEQITCLISDSKISYLRGPERLKAFEASRDKVRFSRALIGTHQIFSVEYWESSGSENDRQFWRCCAVEGSKIEIACGAAICEGCVPSRFSGSKHEYFRLVVQLLNSLGQKETLTLASCADSFLLFEGRPSEEDISRVLGFNEKFLGVSYKRISRRHYTDQFQQSQILIIGQTFG